jgi:hypothetical protein
MLFTDGRTKRECANCGKQYRPRVPDQRYCGPYCRALAKAAEGRAARRVWWRAGRPMQIEDEQQQQERQ